MRGFRRQTAFWCFALIGVSLPIGVFLVGAVSALAALLFALFVAVGIKAIHDKNKLHANSVPWSWKKTAVSTFVVALAAVSTYLLQSRLSPLLASALVAILFAIVWNDVESDAFLGSFLGMTLFGYGSIPLLLLGSAISGLLLSFLGPWLHHAGGRNGFLAFLGVFAAYGLLEDPLTVDAVRTATAFDFLVALTAALCVIEAKNRFRLTGVQASAGVGVILGILMISIPSVPASTWLIGYGATFVAMTTKKVLSDSAVAFASILYPFVYLSIQEVFVGYGGKLGMTALMTVLFVLGIVKLWERLTSPGETGLDVPSRRQIIRSLKPEYRAITVIRMPHSAWLLSKSNDLLTLGVSRIKPMDGVAETSLGIPCRDGAILPATLFLPTNRTTSGAVLYFPGGGFVMRSTPFHKTTAQRFCADLGAAVLFVDYRLAPKHRFPTAFYDAVDAYEWLEQNAAIHGIDPAKIIVGGDSAGGNLALAVALWRRDRAQVPPKGMLLIYPAADRLDAQGSRSTFWNAPMFSGRDYEMVKRHYYGNVSDALMVYAAPLLADTLRGMPPAYIETAEFDPLHDDGERLAKRLEEDGVLVEYHNQIGAPHGYDAAMSAPTTIEMRTIRKRWLQEHLGD